MAAALSLALAVREGAGYLEPAVILVIICLNVVLAVTQERGAERALEALSNLNSPTCLVLRDGARHGGGHRRRGARRHPPAQDW